MKKEIFILLLPLFANAQFFSTNDFFVSNNFFYRATSNIVVANPKKEVIDLGISYEFGNKQAQIIYNITDKYFVFGSYNLNNSTNVYKKLFSDVRINENSNSGFSVGFGTQKLFNWTSFNNSEILFGFEKQEVDRIDYDQNYLPEEKIFLILGYYKFFTQFNMMKNRPRYDLGFSFKLSYLKLNKYDTNDFLTLKNDFTGKSTLLGDATFNFNFKTLKNKNLIFTSQVGFSAAFWTIYDKKEETYPTGGYSIAESTLYPFSPILKFGIQYRINFSK
jgi:hypothetical protein